MTTPTGPNWPFPTKDRPLVPQKPQPKPRNPAYPDDMGSAPW